MIFIVDSGATKATWQLLDGERLVRTIKTSGFNPYYLNSKEMADLLKVELLDSFDFEVNSHVKAIYFYGAGCSGEAINKVVEEALFTYFKKSKLFIHHDMLGAARALCQRSQGITCILGTGSNSCLYDGQHIVDQIPSLGFYLSDEGSGADLGRHLVKHYFLRKLPKDLHQLFDQTYHLSKDELLQKVYKEPFPSRYMANYTKFISTHITHPYLQEMVRGAFDEFIVHRVLPYQGSPNIPIHFIGSIAYYFSDLLKQSLTNRGCKIGQIVQDPMPGLIQYHQK